MWVSIFSTNLSEIFFIIRKNERDVIENVCRSSCKVPSPPILMKFEFPRQIVEIFSNTKFHKNQLSGSRVVPCGRTFGQT